MGTFSFGDHETKVGLEGEATAVAEDAPFRVLLLGDWSGREGRPDAAQSNLAQRRPVEIDRDNFDNVLKKLGAKLDLNFQTDETNPLQLRFAALDDFHPDRIFQQVPLFANLRETRKRLMNSQTFEAAASEVRSWFGISESEKPNPEPQPAPRPLVQPSENLLDQILGHGEENSTPGQKQNVDGDELSVFLGKLVKPYLVQTDEKEQSKLAAALDEASGGLMKMILHHPQFKSLEAAWRAAYFLVGRVETDVDLKIYLLDVTKNELAADLKNAASLTETKFYKTLLETEDGKPWAAVCANYAFSPTVDDVAALMRIAKIAEAADTPFIAQASPDVLGIESLTETPAFDKLGLPENSSADKLWTALRSAPESAYLGLAFPRFLARLPYGAETEPTETFSFEEFDNTSNHKDYLWANPAFVCALLLAQSYRSYGWDMGQRLFQEVDNLPLHTYRQDGETKTKPCAEFTMTLSGCDNILDQGLMALISFRDSDNIRLARFQSIASPLTALRGGLMSSWRN